MLTSDGKYEIYIIECQNIVDMTWFIVNPDKYMKPIEGQFAIMSNCHEKTGIWGSFDLDDMRKLYCGLMKYNPEHRFRVTKLDIWQESTVIWGG